MKSQEQCVHPRILLLWQKVCVKRNQHQFTVVLYNWTFRRHHWNEFCIKTSVWRQLWRIFPKCVFASLSGPAIDLQKMPILVKKIIFLDEAHFDLGGYVNKQNCRIWCTENPHTSTENSTHPKTSHCLVWILVQRHNWAIFLRKWARRDRYRQWRSLSGHVERI